MCVYIRAYPLPRTCVVLKCDYLLVEAHIWVILSYAVEFNTSVPSVCMIDEFLCLISIRQSIAPEDVLNSCHCCCDADADVVCLSVSNWDGFRW